MIDRKQAFRLYWLELAVLERGNERSWRRRAQASPSTGQACTQPTPGKARMPAWPAIDWWLIHSAGWLMNWGEGCIFIVKIQTYSSLQCTVWSSYDAQGVLVPPVPWRGTRSYEMNEIGKFCFVSFRFVLKVGSWLSLNLRGLCSRAFHQVVVCFECSCKRTSRSVNQ